MSPDYYNTLLQALSLLNVAAAGAQDHKEHPDGVRNRANTMQEVAQLFQNANPNEFKPETWQRFRQLAARLGDTAQQLAEECQDPTAVMQLTGGNLKQIILQLKEVASEETERPHGASFLESIKERFRRK
jgi:hypothetical protein